MAKTRKVLISCAVTGAIHTPSMSPHLPITPEEIGRLSGRGAVRCRLQ
ncbi:3-keto-5-aminohexanoate cleavage protein [Roseomonas sp. GCM10028921]